MSWLSENYDKAALGIAAVAAIAVGYSVFSGGDKVEAPRKAVPNNTVEIEQRSGLATAKAKFSADYGFDGKESNGNEVRSFISTPLYSIKGKSGIHALDDDFEIHPGMKLGWWKGYKLDAYKLEDGPELDSDKDGFDNRAEHDAATDPTDVKSHPDFIAKLKCTDIKDQPYTLGWTRLDANRSMFSFRVRAPKGAFQRDSDTATLGIGGRFPARPRNKSFTNRFEALERKQDPAIPGENGEYYLLKDTAELHNKGQFKLYYGKRANLKDYTSTLHLDIDGMETPFDVPMGGKFSLPFDPESKSKPYTFKSQKDNKVEIEYEVDGEKKSVEIEVSKAK